MSVPAYPTWRHDWPTAVIGLGIFWLIVGVALTPSPTNASSWYHNVVTVLLFLPALWMAARHRAWVGRRVRDTPELILVVALLAWSCISLTWAGGTHVVERVKIPLQVAAFLIGWLFWVAARGADGARTLLRLAGYAMAAGALAAILAFPYRHNDFPDRITGFAMLDGPNLSGYVMGAVAVWLFQLPPARRWEQCLWLASLCCLLAFAALTLSRGTWLAIFVVMLVLPLFDRSAKGWVSSVLALAAGAVAMVVGRRLLEARGVSYRPQIWEQAQALIRERPFRGLGLDTPYTITVGTQSWTHSHNLFTNLAIELGVPALLCWLGAWLLLLRRGWTFRHDPLGRIVLGLWVFSTVALQLDGPALLMSPRPEWLLTWLPLAIGAALVLPSPTEPQEPVSASS
jgi:O-antigen ligase